MSKWSVFCWLLVCCALAVGCSRQARKPDEGKPARPDKKYKIKAELSVEPKYLTRSTSESVKIKVFVTNLQDKVKSLEFDTSQKYSLYAMDENGRQYRLGHSAPVPSTMTLQPLETKVYDLDWDGHILTEGDVVYLPLGRYEMEARVKDALSNTVYVYLRE